jgi:hypothetical protein
MFVFNTDNATTEASQEASMRRDCAFPPFAPTHEWVDFDPGTLTLSPLLQQSGDGNECLRDNAVAILVARHVYGIHGEIEPGSDLYAINMQSKLAGTGHVWSLFPMPGVGLKLVVLTNIDEGVTAAGFQHEMPSPSEVYNQ